MKQRIPPHIAEQLRKFEAENALRVLPPPRQGAESLVDFSSNDYLGLAKRPLPQGPWPDAEGATGSRLLSGNHAAHEALEAACTEFFRGESSLLFNSGYQANMALLSCLPQRGDSILYDERSHASIKDGLRLSLARHFSFRHNDLTDLERLLKKASGPVWIVAEGLYSMDGDWAEIEGISNLAEQYGAYLILDEAHSTGTVGKGGRGLACHSGLEGKVLAKVYTFGKAIGYHGAVVVVPDAVRSYLVNRARAFIYTTALPPAAAYVLQERLKQMEAADGERGQLALLENCLAAELGLSARSPNSPIFPFLQTGNNAVKALAKKLQGEGFDVRPILSPTVPAGREQLRIVLHSYNTLDQVQGLAAAIMRHRNS